MKRILSLALMCALMVSESANLGAQIQKPGVVAGNVLQADGVISGSVSSSSGRSLSGITMQMVDARGTVVGKTVTARNGDFTFQAIAYDTYTVQCVDKDKVIGTSSVILKAPTESIRMTCTSDEAFWMKTGVLTGLVAAAAAISAAAVASGGGDASRVSSGAAVVPTTFDASGSR